MIQQILDYYMQNGGYVLEQFFRHFLIAIYGTLFACLIAIPLGFYLARHRKMSAWVIKLANIIQTIPSLAMLSILMIGMGIGANTVVVTVLLYALLPILKNTYTAVINVDASLIDVAKGMGMTPWQVLYKVELPLAVSVILGGVRNALVVAIGVTAIGTFIGAGGLGDIISRGINVSNGSAIVWAGAIPTALMAISVDLILGYLEKQLTKINA